MINNAIDFLKNILTDQYKDGVGLKVDALDLYTKLITEGTIPTLTFPIPFSSNTLSIDPANLNRAKEEVKAGRKITAIKIIREHGWLNQDKTQGGPSLKEAKDFVESFPI
jgi:hypothetical protein